MLAAAAIAALQLLGPVPLQAARRDAAVPPIVFVSRYPILDDTGRPEPGAIPGIGPLGRSARVGGRLLVREPDGAVRVLVDTDVLFDVADPCVSWDGTKILFSGLAHPDSSWRLFTVAPDGTRLSSVTRSDRYVALSVLGPAAARFVHYDDLDPCWLPDGRIVFSTTRFPAISEGADMQTTNLYIVEEDGACLDRVTAERSGAEEPSIDPVTGRIVYSRWWINRDRPSDVTRDGITTLDHQAIATDIANIWQTAAINPDGTHLKMHAGDPRSRAGSICYKPVLLPDGRVLALTAANGSFFPSPLRTGIRLFAPGADSGRAVIGLPMGDSPSEVGEAPPVDAPEGPSALDPAPIGKDRLVVSYRPGLSPDEDYGLYLASLTGRPPELLYDAPGTHELDAVVLGPRPIPPILEDHFQSVTADLPPTEDPATFYVNDTFRFDCMNAFANAPVDAPIPDAPNITQGAKIRFFMNFQRMNPRGRDASILWRTTDLTPRGAIHQEDVPAEVSMFEQLIGPDGKVLSTPSGKAAHVVGLNFARQGEGVKCIGCHAGHSVLPTATSYAAGEWFNCSTSATVQASSEWLPAGAAASPFGGSRLVDRRARNDSLEVAWVAAGADTASALITWPIPIEIRELVLYGIRANRREGTDLRVEKCGILLMNRGNIVGQITVGPIKPEGTAVGTPITSIDAVRIIIERSHGRVRRERLTGLAEVEVSARLIDSIPEDVTEREGTE